MNTGHIFLYWQIGLLFTTRKSCLVLNDSAKKFMVASTERRIAIMDAILARTHGDRHILINELMRKWALDNLDEGELAVPVEQIFAEQF
jgi:hypothetical protein